MLRINPPTAALPLSEYIPLNPGDWIVQNAANSVVGRAVIAFARARGIRTVYLVRRPELIDELFAVGGDIVLLQAVRWKMLAEADAIAYTQTTCSTGAIPTPQSSAANIMDKPCSPTWQAFIPTQPHKPGNKN
jgi:NADPH:quinone reductase-like Zn-dependent oxidoreductase